MANCGKLWHFETVAGDSAVRVAVRQETEPCGGWVVRGSPRHEPTHDSSVWFVRTAAVCGTMVNTMIERFFEFFAFDFSSIFSS